MRLLTRLLGAPSDPWYWSADAFPPVAFCVRALVLDGMAFSPFDLHAEGDGSLRALGLDPGTWREWVLEVLRQRTIMGEYARVLGTPEAGGPLLDRVRAAGEVLRRPGAFCPGTPELRARLNELFADYAPTGETWKWQLLDARRLHGSGRQQRTLWKALAPFHNRLATLSVFLVEYPAPVVMPLPPTMCLVAPEDDPAGFGRQVVAAAEALAATS